MYEHKHIICTVADEEVFYRQCAALEKHIPGLQKEDELQDVDGSFIQGYKYGNKSIVVINDIEAGLVRLNSEIPLEPFFEKKSEEATTQSAPSDRQKRRKSALSPAPAN